MKFAAKTSVYLLLVIAILAMAFLACFISIPTKENIPYADVEKAATINWSSMQNTAFGYTKDGDTLEDGAVPDGYSSTYTAYTGGVLNGSTNYKLTGNVSYEKNNNVLWEGEKYSNATFDGCGKTISLKTHYTRSSDIKGTFGYWTQYMENVTIKNVTIELDFAYKNTKTCNDTVYMGLMAGKGTNVTFKNVKFIIKRTSSSLSHLTNTYVGSDQSLFMGHVFGQADNCRFENVTVDFQTSVPSYVKAEGAAWNNSYYLYGVFAGSVINGGTLKNITFRGSNVELKSSINNSGAGAKMHSREGLIFGKVESAITIDGIDIGGMTGSVNTGGNRQVGKLIGEKGGSGTWSLSNIFYKSGSFYTLNLNICGSDASITASNERTYTIAEDKIGFSKSNPDYFWVGKITSYNGTRGQGVNGTYPKSVTIGENVYSVGEGVAPEAVRDGVYTTKGHVIAMFKKANYTGSITAFDDNTGKFAYVANEVNSFTAEGGHTYTRQRTTNTYDTYYNTNAVTNVVSQQKVYRAGSTVSGVTKEINDWSITGEVKNVKRDNNNNVTTYDYTKSGLTDEFLGGDYYALYGTSSNGTSEFNMSIKINPTPADNITITPNIANENDSGKQLTQNGTTYTKEYDGVAVQMLTTNPFKVYVYGNEETTSDRSVSGNNQGQSVLPNGIAVVNVKRDPANSNPQTNVMDYVYYYVVSGNNVETKNFEYKIRINPFDIDVDTEAPQAFEYDGTNQDRVRTELGIPSNATVTYYKINSFNGTTNTLLAPAAQIQLQNDQYPKDVGDYRAHVEPLSDQNANILEGDWTFAIYPKTVQIDYIKKNYDKTNIFNTVDPGSEYSLSGLCQNESISLSGQLCTFSDVNVAANGAFIPVTIDTRKYVSYQTAIGQLQTGTSTYYRIRTATSTYTNYAFEEVANVNKGIIAPWRIDVLVASKQYDANNNLYKMSSILDDNQAQIGSYLSIQLAQNILYAGDVNPFSLLETTAAIATFAQSNVGTGIGVTFNSNALETFATSSITVANRIKGTNYALFNNTYNVGEIFPKQISLNTASRVFDETNNLTVGVATFKGFVSGQSKWNIWNQQNDKNTVFATYNDKHVESNKTVTIKQDVFRDGFAYNENGERINIRRILASNYCFDYSNQGVSYQQSTNQITRTKVVLKFDDNKDLYDSILDYDNSDHYDFIYVKNSDYTNTYFADFDNRYAKYFTHFIMANGTLMDISQYVSISKGSISKDTIAATALTYSWNITDTDNNNPSSPFYKIKDNYNIQTVRVFTTGSGRSEGLTYCETAYSESHIDDATRFVRIRVVEDLASSETDENSNNVLNKATLEGINPPIYQFMTSHYYDNNTYAQKTTFQLPASSTWWVDRLFTGARIMPSYKTLDGNNSTWEYKSFPPANNQITNGTTRSNRTNQIAGTKDDVATAMEAEDLVTGASGNIESHKTSYPGYLTYNGELYHGGGMLLALNYGTIKNFTISYWHDVDHGNRQGSRHEIKGFKEVNTALGALVGINAGIISNNTIRPNRLFTFHSRSGGTKDFAYGSVAGLNLGKIEGTELTLYNYLDDKYNDWGQKTNYHGTYILVEGSSRNAYFGIFTGLNGEGSILNSQTDLTTTTKRTYTHQIRVDVSITAAQTVFAGGLVGKNSGLVRNYIFQNNQANYKTETADKDQINIGQYQGNEFTVQSRSNLVVGGICGYNEYGVIENCEFNNSACIKAVPTQSNKIAYLGGICGYNKGDQSWTSGVIQNCKVENNKCYLDQNVNNPFNGMEIGDKGYYNSASAIYNTVLKSYALGGVVGVTDGGVLHQATMINRGVLQALTSQPQSNNTDFFAGILLGVGCEEGTTSASNRMLLNATPFNSSQTRIYEGQMTNCQAFNFNSDHNAIGANYGFWGYVAGTYNTIATGNENHLTNIYDQEYDYVHNYGSIIWYTSGVPIQENGTPYTKTIFGGIASVLGQNKAVPNPASASENVYITGIAGVGLYDFADQQLGKYMLDSISIEDNKVFIGYKAPSGFNGASGVYKGVTAFVPNENDEIELMEIQQTGTAAWTTSLVSATTGGTIRIPIEKANAEIYTLRSEASVAEVYACMHVDISEQWHWLAFFGDRVSIVNSGITNHAYDAQAQAYSYAGYANITQSFRIDGNQRTTSSSSTVGYTSRELKKYRTVDGTVQENTLTFTWGSYQQQIPNAETYNYVMTNDRGGTQNVHAIGLLVGGNNGIIKNLNIIVDPTNGGKINRTEGVNDGFSYLVGGNDITAIGTVAGVNRGIIENCKIKLRCRYDVEMTRSNYDSQVLLSGGVGLNDGGTINYAYLNYENGLLRTWSSGGAAAGKKLIVAVGSMVGAANGGRYERLQVFGDGTIRDMDDANNPLCNYDELYFGGIFGYMPLSQTVKIKDFYLTPISYGNIDRLTFGVRGITFKGLQNNAIQNRMLKNGSSGYIAGVIASTVAEADSPSVYNNILAADVHVISYGDVDAFQKAGRYENSLYGYLEDYTKDYSRLRDRPEFKAAIMTSRFVIQDGSTNGRGAVAQTTSVTLGWENHNINGVTIEFTWADGTKEQSITVTEKTCKTESSVLATTTIASASGITRPDDRGFKILFNVKYRIEIAAENLTWNNNDAITNSNFMNFISGRGNKWIYAGATYGDLKGMIGYNKQVTAVIEMNERKTLNGHGNVVEAQWECNDAGHQIMGLTETIQSGGNTVGANNADNEAEYNLWYEANTNGSTIRYYGVSDMISINRGQILNLKFRTKYETKNPSAKHHYKGLTGSNANTAYGAFVGINLGTIKDNCESLTSLSNNRLTIFTAQETRAELLASPGVGLNNGLIEDYKVRLETPYIFAGNARSLIMGGVVAVNAYAGELRKVECIINGSIERKTVVTAHQDGTVAFGGLVGINDGGAINYATISGTGNIMATSCDEATFNKVEDPTIITNADGTQTAVPGTGGPKYINDANYMFFAVGVAISNNEAGKNPTFAGHNIMPCVVERNDGTYANKVSNIMLKFEGNLVFSTPNSYMMGLAFARASSTAQATATAPAYEGIIIDSVYSSFLELISVNVYLQKGKYWGNVLGAGLPLMGHVDLNVGSSNFIVGGRIDANAEVEISWNTATGDINVYSDGGLMTNLNGVYLEEMPDRLQFGEYTAADTGYITYNKVSSPSTVILRRPLINQMENENSRLTQVTIDFYFPYAKISDAFQLRQFLEFDAKDTMEIFKRWYLVEYQNEIIKLINEGQKGITSINDSPYYKAWAKADVIDAVISRVEHSKFVRANMHDVTVNGVAYVLLPEIFEDEAGNVSTIYESQLGSLEKDIVLDKYEYIDSNNETTTIDIDVGWKKTVYFEMDENKILNGKGHNVTIVATSYKKERINLPDKGDTVAKDQDVYIAAGFIGILRGVVKNVNFLFKEGTHLNLVGANMDSFLDLRYSLFAGIVSGYMKGTIDNCTLKMEDNTQLYVYKVRDEGGVDFWNQNISTRTTQLVGGFSGFLGKGGVISNSTLTMGENAILAVNSQGKSSSGVQGSIFNYIGGFAGQMASNSQLYNIKIDGAASSAIMSFGCTYTSAVGVFNCFYSGTGGIVGCNSSKSDWDPQGVGKGYIDGVIFNWRGACLNTIWFDKGMFGTNAGGNRDKMDVTYYGGAALGVSDNGAAINFYYTFEISSFDKDLNQDFTNGTASGTSIYIHGTSVQTLATAAHYSASTTFYTKNSNNEYLPYEFVATAPAARRAEFNSKIGQLYTTKTHPMNINPKGTFNFDEKNKNALCFSDIIAGSNAIVPKTLRVYEMTNDYTIGTGITYTTNEYTQIEYQERTTIYRNVGPVTVNQSAYTELTSMGDVLKWADTTRGSDILCSFEADPDDIASVMWSINIVGAENRDNRLINAQNTFTEIPVYRFATDIDDAQSYKSMNYVIKRGEGDGMSLYYCTGNAATLSPDKNYYSNQISGGPTAYHPLAAVMYDGVTDAKGLAISIYDQNGNSIERLQSVTESIVTKAKDSVVGGIKPKVQIKKSTGYEDYDETKDELTAVGSYKITYYIYSNNTIENSNNTLNPNAYVDTDYRTQFFSSDGSAAITIPENSSLGIPAGQLVEEYSIEMVIAPISINVTKIEKKYDSTKQLFYTSQTNKKNNASITAVLDQRFTYSPTATSTTINYSDQTGEISVPNTRAKIKFAGEFDDPNVGNRSVILNLESNKLQYTIYELTQNGYITKNITQYYLMDASSSTTSYFTLSDITVKKSESGNNQVWDAQDANPTTYTLINEGSRVVRIREASPPTITVNAQTLEYMYTGSNITYGQELESWITVKDGWDNVLENVQELIANGTITITPDGDPIKDVVQSGYNRRITVRYKESGTSNLGEASTAVDVQIFVLPKQLQVTKVIKEFDNNTNTTNAQFKVRVEGTGSVNSYGLLGSDTTNGISGTYISKDVAENITVSMAVNNMSINSKSFNVILNNYYLQNASVTNVGVITPVKASILNAYKTFDGKNTVLYSGNNITNILIKTTQSPQSVLDIKPNNVEFGTINAGKTTLRVPLIEFTYQDINGNDVKEYLLQNNGVQTNYSINGANSTNYITAEIAYILPKEIEISLVQKVYDANTTLGEFVATGMVPGFEVTTFAGEYSDANVKKVGNTYNDVYLTTQNFEYATHANGTIVNGSVGLLTTASGTSNYAVAAGANVTNEGGRVVISGIGLIAPKPVTLVAVKKYYDRTNTFNNATYNEADERIYAELNVDGTSVKNYYISGTMNGRDATNGVESSFYNVTVNSEEFAYKGVTYAWLVHEDNINNNYCLTSATVNKVGDVLRLTLYAQEGNTSLNGIFYDLRFTTTTMGTIKLPSSATYLKDQEYSIDNFEASINWDGVKTLKNGRITLDGSTLEFKFKNNVVLETAGSYTITLTMESSGNFAFDETAFTFTIQKRNLDASEIQVRVSGNVTKEYDGTVSLDNITAPTYISATAATAAAEGKDNITFSSVTVNAAGVNNSIIIFPNGSTTKKNAGKHTEQLRVRLSITHNNYSFSGEVTQIYTNSSYSEPIRYEILQKEVSLTEVVEKEFDGHSGAIAVAGVNKEIVMLSYSMSEGGMLPGVYEGVTAAMNIDSVVVEEGGNQDSNTGNYKITGGTLNLTVNNARVNIEREFKETRNNVNYFQVAVSMAGLKGLGFLTQAYASLTSATIKDFITNNSTMPPELKIAIVKLFGVKYNDTNEWYNLSEENIIGAKIVKNEIQSEVTYSFEFYISNEKLDNETFTDRYSIFMRNRDLTTELGVDISTVIGSNIAQSSSALAEGQFDGSYEAAQGETPISTVAELLTFMTGTSTNGYLTRSIHGFDASKLTTNTFNKTLDGNGYTITLTGGTNVIDATPSVTGAFIANNEGTLMNINFVYASTVTIDLENAKVGLVVGTNRGTIKNCSVKIISDPVIGTITNEQTQAIEPIAVDIAGFVGVNENIMEMTSLILSTPITAASFAGLVFDSSNGQLNYISLRQISSATISIAETAFALANVGPTNGIQYLIDALDFAHTTLSSGAVAKTYDQNSTKLKMFSTINQNGFLDYYFTTNAKMTTATNKHNEYSSAVQNNVNTSYYYGYNQNKGLTDISVAIEVIAPFNRFIWEAFDANYTTYQTNLNRAVGLFDLEINLKDSQTDATCDYNGDKVTDITFITSYQENGVTIYVTIFNPAIGVIAETVISSGTDTVQEYEYTGSEIQATFAVTVDGEQQTLLISGTEVGSYTEYFKEGTTGTAGSIAAPTFNPDNRTATVLSSSGEVGAAKIMLIITPKVEAFTATLTKEYDSTNIAETQIDINNDLNHSPDIYAVGTYSSNVVGTGYSVRYNSYTKPVAAHYKDGQYYFVTTYLAGIETGTTRRIYNVEYIYMGGVQFTSATSIPSQTANNANYARAYSEMVTMDRLQAINDSQNSVLNFAIPGITQLSDLQEVYVYDLIFEHSVSNEPATKNKVTYGEGIYYAGTMFNVPQNIGDTSTINKNYKWIISTANTFDKTTIIANDQTALTMAKSHEVTSNRGFITRRTINAEYSNLNQSYRFELSPISVEIGNVSNLDNIPYSITQEKYNDLISAINTEISTSANFTADVLGATINAGETRIERVGTEGAYTYRATTQAFDKITLEALEGSYDISGNLAVNITGSATLTLRYFKAQTNIATGETKYIIESIEDLIKIGDIEDKAATQDGNDYDTLNYIITKDIHAKSRTIESIQRVFKGTIDGNGKTIKHFVLIGNERTALFNELNEDARIYDLLITNVMVLPKATVANVAIVADILLGSIENVSIDAEVAIASNQSVTISPLAIQTTGTTQNNKAFIQTNASIENTNNTLSNLTNDTGSKIVLMFRSYGNKNIAANIAKIRISGDDQDKALTDIDTAIIQLATIGLNNRINPLTINAENKVEINNFRQYWAYINICPWLGSTLPAAVSDWRFVGYEFEL